MIHKECEQIKRAGDFKSLKQFVEYLIEKYPKQDLTYDIIRKAIKPPRIENRGRKSAN